MKHHHCHVFRFAWLVLLAAFLLPASLPAQFPGFGGSGTTTSGRTGGRSGSSPYPNSTQMGEAMIMADPETRRIIVITDDETAHHISQVVTNLDRPRPQVLIKVIFVEVTLNDDKDVGTSITKANLELSNSSLVSSFTTGLGAPAAIPGGVLSVASGDFGATMSAMAALGKTEVLSRPSILTRNNQEAVISVGQEVPFITNSRIDDTTGAILNTVQYEDVGIKLRVTPFITQDGLVEMIVAPEISAISDTKVVVGPGVELNLIDKRAAETVVVTKHGQTIIIGGLMQKRKEETLRKVPVLGDIPLLGLAFKRKINVDRKTELLIFMTPYVVQHPGDLAALAGVEASGSQLQNRFGKKDLDLYVPGVPIPPSDNPTNSEAQKPALPIVIPLK